MDYNYFIFYEKVRIYNEMIIAQRGYEIDIFFYNIWFNSCLIFLTFLFFIEFILLFIYFIFLLRGFLDVKIKF